VTTVDLTPDGKIVDSSDAMLNALATALHAADCGCPDWSPGDDEDPRYDTAAPQTVDQLAAAGWRRESGTGVAAVDPTYEDRITDEAVRAAAEAIEDETFRRIGPGRDLDDIHREGIARAALLAALPLLGTAWLGDRVECADCGRTSGYCKCGDIDAAEMARLMRERVLRESTQDECSGYEDFVAVGPDEVVLPLVTAAAAEKIAEARYRAGREAAARDIQVVALDETLRPVRDGQSRTIETWLWHAAAIARGNEPVTGDLGVWAVVFSNYEPPEIDGLYLEQVDAEARAGELGVGWHAVKWEISLGRSGARERGDNPEERQR
jgi:hypothetical protein